MKHDYETIEEKVKRNLKQMYSNEMEYCAELEKVAKHFISNKQGDSDWRWQWISLLTVIYKIGHENGVQDEREKKHHGKKWVY